MTVDIDLNLEVVDEQLVEASILGKATGQEITFYFYMVLQGRSVGWSEPWRH
jgi:hypothetical protein